MTVTARKIAVGRDIPAPISAERAELYGLLGERLAAGVRQGYAKRFGAAPTGLTCPYLRGEVGNRVVCHGAGRDVEVVVTAVDPASYRAVYVIRAHRPRPTP